MGNEGTQAKSLIHHVIFIGKKLPNRFSKKKYNTLRIA